MLCATRFFERASGHGVFVLSNCCVGRTPPLGQSDKCRDRLAFPSLSNLFITAPCLSHCPLPWAQPPPSLPFTWNWHLERKRDASGFPRYPRWVIIDIPPNYESVLWNYRQSPFPGRLYLVLFKWNWTELLNFCQLELFPSLLNHLRTTCFPPVFPPVTWVSFSDVQAIMLCNAKQNFAFERHKHY